MRPGLLKLLQATETKTPPHTHLNKMINLAKQNTPKPTKTKGMREEFKT